MIKSNVTRLVKQKLELVNNHPYVIFHTMHQYQINGDESIFFCDQASLITHRISGKHFVYSKAIENVSAIIVICL